MFAPLLGAIRLPRTGPGRGGREPADQAAHRRRRGSRGGRPVTYDRIAYRGRNVIQQAFNQLKAWRGIATRYDKHATDFRGAVVLASILLWLRH